MIYNFLAFRQVHRELKLDKEELDKIIFNKLKDVLVSSYLHVPFYKKIMKEIGYNPVTDYSGPDDLKKLPVTSKKDYKESPKNYFIKEGINLENKFSDFTSGSTGIPLKVYRDKYERALQIAKWIRVLSANGYKINERVMSFSSPHRVNEGKTFLNYLGLLRRRSVNYNCPLTNLVDEFINYNPDYLYSSTSLLNLACIELQKRNFNNLNSNLKIVFNMGETLIENDREFFKNILGADVINTFGTVEAGILTYETREQNGMHLCRDLTYYEFLDEKGNSQQPGKPARLIITDLSDKLMPFIRYDHGDRVTYDFFDSGNKEPEIRITKIIGREDDFINRPDGRKLPIQNVSEFLVVYEDIRQYRFVQKIRHEVDLLIAADENYFDKINKKIYSDLLPVLNSLKLNIIRVDSIPLDKSGKLRQIINEIKIS